MRSVVATILVTTCLLSCTSPPKPPASISNPDPFVRDSDSTDSGSDAADGFDRVALGLEFPEAEDGIKQLQYGRYEGVMSCVEEGEFLGEIEIAGTALSALVVTFDSGERQETTVERELSAEELANLQTRILDIPPKELQMPHNCDPCVVSSLRVDGHLVGHECCGVCNDDFMPAFDRLADFLQDLVTAA